jgi:hypothetical protein
LIATAAFRARADGAGAVFKTYVGLVKVHCLHEKTPLANNGFPAA